MSLLQGMQASIEGRELLLQDIDDKDGEFLWLWETDNLEFGLEDEACIHSAA